MRFKKNFVVGVKNRRAPCAVKGPPVPLAFPPQPTPALDGGSRRLRLPVPGGGRQDDPISSGFSYLHHPGDFLTKDGKLITRNRGVLRY